LEQHGSHTAEPQADSHAVTGVARMGERQRVMSSRVLHGLEFKGASAEHAWARTWTGSRPVLALWKF
jgi:hypothetical protein